MPHPVRSRISLIAVAMFVGACGGGLDADVQVQRYFDTVNPMFKEATAARECRCQGKMSGVSVERLCQYPRFRACSVRWRTVRAQVAAVS